MREDCDRFRVIAALQPDGELSSLELAWHRAHAAACDDCRGYAAELAAITARIRATPAQSLPAPVALGTSSAQSTDYERQLLRAVRRPEAGRGVSKAV